MPVPLQTALPDPVEVWGLPLAPLTFDETLDAVDGLIEAGGPAFFVTANLHYARLSATYEQLRRVNREAAFLVADGTPLVWASRGRLPGRVAGADLVPALCRRAAWHRRGVFLLGGAPGVAEEAGRVLAGRFPGLRIAGAESPPFRPATPEEHAALVGRVRAARPELLFVAFGQPKGELWLAEHVRELGVPACVQVGGSLDFVAGRVRRAPKAVQRAGLEWAWRVAQEPRRLGLRYGADAAFLARRLADRRAASARA